MDRFLKNAKVVRIVDGNLVDVGPIANSKFSEHVTQTDSFGKVPKSKEKKTKPALAAKQQQQKEEPVAKAPKKAASRKNDGMGVATNLGTIEHASTVNEVMAIRVKEVEDHEREMASLLEKLSQVEEQLKDLILTRANIDHRKKLIERRDAVRAEIVRKRGKLPSMAQMTQEMLEFYEERENVNKRRKTTQGDEENIEKGKSFPAVTIVTHKAPEEKKHDPAVAILFQDVGVPRIADVTFGAPLLEYHEFQRLEAMLRISNNNKKKDKIDSKKGEEDMKEDEEMRFQEENALADIDKAFDEAIRVEVAANGAAKTHDVLIAAYLISNASRGWNAVDAEDERLAEKLTSENDKENAAAIGKKLLGNQQQSQKQGLSMTTIGSNRGHVPTGSKIRNRLNIKMKDIRNAENVSMFNFCRVQKRKRTDQEKETIDFVRFIGSTHYNDFERDISYDDPKCANCNSELDIDMHSGMETCSKCGLAVYGKLGREIIPLEQPMHNKYQYLKVGHMKTILMRSQGKETTRIPPKVPNDVIKQLQMERANLDEVDAFRVKKTLKKLGYSKWYDHMHQITHIVTGRPPQQFSKFEEELILSIFEHLVEPYERHRPQNQENFPVSVVFVSLFTALTQSI